MPLVNRSSNRPRAFTLVELLVVIGIIAILISILLPVLAKVRQSSNTAKCGMNLRTLAQGWRLYVEANKDTCPPVRLPAEANQGGPSYSTPYGLQYRPRWYELIGYQLKTPARRVGDAFENDTWQVESSLYICPERPEWTNSRNFPYGYNYQFLGDARMNQANTKMINYPVRAGNLKASKTVMAADSMGTAAGKPNGAARKPYISNGDKDPDAWGNKGFHLDPPRLTANSDYADEWYPSPPYRSGPDPRHNGKVNVAFCDSHVELMSLQEMGYNVQLDGRQLVDAPASNALFSGTGEDILPPPFK
jgi:prepilin-type processing-associated H-X9-DG protein/prepilin-type N-terminal cleavage/methylation domain-containing protein